VLAALPGSPPAFAHTRVIAIDGPAGSGKTSLAQRLEAHLEGHFRAVTTIHMDDLYAGWTGLNTALEERVVAQLLRPLASGRTARWQQYDWYAQRFDRWHDLPAPDVLILEGCGSGAARYASYTSLLVWLEAEPETRLSRGIERDGEQVRQDWLRWMALEAGYFAANSTAQRADLTCHTG
jgi:uridine kinase